MVFTNSALTVNELAHPVRLNIWELIPSEEGNENKLARLCYSSMVAVILAWQ